MRRTRDRRHSCRARGRRTGRGRRTLPPRLPMWSESLYLSAEDVGAALESPMAADGGGSCGGTVQGDHHFEGLGATSADGKDAGLFHQRALRSALRGRELGDGRAEALSMSPTCFESPPRPKLSYSSMIARAIGSTERRRMFLSDIYDYIMVHFAYYRQCDPGWKVQCCLLFTLSLLAHLDVHGPACTLAGRRVCIRMWPGGAQWTSHVQLTLTCIAPRTLSGTPCRPRRALKRLPLATGIRGKSTSGASRARRSTRARPLRTGEGCGSMCDAPQPLKAAHPRRSATTRCCALSTRRRRRSAAGGASPRPHRRCRRGAQSLSGSSGWRPTQTWTGQRSIA